MGDVVCKIQYFDGTLWSVKEVGFRPSALEWSSGSTPILYASDNMDNLVYMSSNPNADFPEWVQIGESGSGIGQFDNPNGMFTTSSGALYVVDTGNNRIQYRSNGTWDVMITPPSAIYLVDICKFGETTYITDSINHCIYYKNPSTSQWEKIEDSTYLNYPTYIDVDSNGNLYILSWCVYPDGFKKSIVKYSDGIFSLHIPSGSSPGEIENTFSFEEININIHDKLFYADSSTGRIVKGICETNTLSSLITNGTPLQLTSFINWSVSTEIEEITISAFPECNYSSIIGNGKFPLDFGSNIFIITCLSETGAVNDYTLDVTRELSSNAILSDISINEVSITNFNSHVCAYTGIIFPNETETVNLTAVSEDENAVVSGTGIITLSVGDNTILITVMAQDGITMQPYLINITREPLEPLPTAKPTPTPSHTPIPSPSPTPEKTVSPSPTESMTTSPIPPSPTPSSDGNREKLDIQELIKTIGLLCAGGLMALAGVGIINGITKKKKQNRHNNDNE